MDSSHNETLYFICVYRNCNFKTITNDEEEILCHVFTKHNENFSNNFPRKCCHTDRQEFKLKQLYYKEITLLLPYYSEANKSV